MQNHHHKSNAEQATYHLRSTIIIRLTHIIHNCYWARLFMRFLLSLQNYFRVSWPIRFRSLRCRFRRFPPMLNKCNTATVDLRLPQVMDPLLYSPSVDVWRKKKILFRQTRALDHVRFKLFKISLKYGRYCIFLTI